MPSGSYRDEDRERRLRRAQSCWEHSQVPPRYTLADIRQAQPVNSAYAGVLRDLRALLLKPRLLALLGERGTGKTWLACALIREFCRACRRARYYTAWDIFREIRRRWRDRDGEDEAEFIDDLADLPLLVVDEVQVRAASDWENHVLTDLLDRRYRLLRPTVLIANLTPAAMVTHLGDSIGSRMQEAGAILMANWPSFRAMGTAIAADPPAYAAGRRVWPPVIEGATPLGPTGNLRQIAPGVHVRGEV